MNISSGSILSSDSSDSSSNSSGSSTDALDSSSSSDNNDFEFLFSSDEAPSSDDDDNLLEDARLERCVYLCSLTYRVYRDCRRLTATDTISCSNRLSLQMYQ